MKTPRTTISRTISDKTLSGMDSARLSQEVAAFLLSEGRVSELDSILRDVQADRAEAGYVEVIAASAHSLSAPARTDIAKQVRRLYPFAKRVIISEVRDAEVLGGVRLSFANQQLDLSVEAKLNKFKQLTAGKD
jgi:F0F1-type ATP synthase delta subunit